MTREHLRFIYTFVQQIKCRPLGIVLVVTYKVLMAITTIFLLFALKNHQWVTNLAQSYIWESKLEIIGWLLEKVTTLKLSTLLFRNED